MGWVGVNYWSHILYGQQVGGYMLVCPRSYQLGNPVVRGSVWDTEGHGLGYTVSRQLIFLS